MKRMEFEMWHFLTSLVAHVLVIATLFVGGVALAAVGIKAEGKSLWLKMVMYASVAASFAAVFYAVCLLAVGVLV